MSALREVVPGGRVAFVRDLPDVGGTAFLLGYGTYVGKVLPTAPEGAPRSGRKGKLAAALRRAGKPACKFKLDSGRVVWQWDGWWMDEADFRERMALGRWKVVEVEGGR